MSQLILAAAGALVLATSTGCGPALHPFYTQADLYEDPALAGFWTDGKETWEFRHVSDSKYTIAECDPECKDPIPATLFRLGGTLFVDFQESPGKMSSAIYPHGVLRVQINGDRVEVTGLNDDAFKQLVEEKRVGLSHVTVGTRFLVTSSSAKLQQFLSRHSGDPQVWGETQTYQRATDPPAATPSQAGS